MNKIISLSLLLIVSIFGIKIANVNAQSYVPGCPVGYTCTLTVKTTNGPVSSSQLTLTTPNGGETFVTGKQIYVVWNTKNGTFNLKPDSRTQIYLLKGNSVVANYDYLANDGAEYITIPPYLQSGNDYKISVTVYSKTPEGGQSDDSDGTFTINLDNPTCATEYPGYAGSMVKNLCGVINNTTNSTVATAYLLNTFDDKAGIWDKFSSGAGNLNKSNFDWNWYLNLNVPAKHSDIASITITNDQVNEGWSTSVADVKGRAPYPLVVLDGSGKQLNTKYDQVIKFPEGANGSYSYKLYGQIESEKFYGGTLTIKFVDNTTTTTYVYNSNYKPSPVQYSTVVPNTSIVNTGSAMVNPADAKVKISDVSIYDNGKKLSSPISLVVGKRYTITWSAQDVPSSGGFYVVMQSASRPDLYGVITRRILAPSIRSYDWTPTSKTDSDFRIGVTNGDTRAYSQPFKVYTSAQVIPTPSPSPTPTPYSSYLPSTTPKPSPSPTPTPYSSYKPVVSPTPTPSVTPSPSGVYPSSGLPGSSVVFVVPNTGNLPLTYGDFNFGNYGLLNFKILDNKTVTFTVPYEAKAGSYEVVWFGGNSYAAKYTVLAK